MATIITSRQNDRVKELLKLYTKRGREKLSKYIVEGAKEVEFALNSGAKLVAVWVAESAVEANKKLLEAISDDVEKITVPDSLFEAISYKNKEEGILAVSKKHDTSMESLDKRVKLSEKAVILVLDRIDKPGNIGALMRTADAVGACGVIITNQSTDMFNPNVIRSSVGTFFTIPWVITTPKEAKLWLKKSRFLVVGAHPHAKKSLYETELPSKMALVVGNEHEGLSTYWQEETDINVAIPMLGKNDSLNVNVSTGVILYEWVRQVV